MSEQIDLPESCNQQGCENKAAYRFTWPGRDEAGICEDHVEWLEKVVDAMGFPLQVIPLEPQEGNGK